ncbi:DNA replication factor Cdt1 [Pseudolycoriella hygida]|uniref:DNA replication factor Cdt1 n=1 Tax=Pseudolycoriella hygida TaxID=35572 RepID=A0A9Q0N342_9DIPT|nr:DNA replication factor Cdt1 [Pseudolycoriella hygida]
MGSLPMFAIVASPQKGLYTPTKSILPMNFGDGESNELMSPKKTATPRRLFSPTKETPSTSQPAYQRFQSLVESGRPTLQLPYKYRCLAETFKCLDTVCSMFFNRHETITMKKLKPAVQRMLRKNFSESSLAQIAHLYPEAYKFSQKKMTNPGSLTKYDYYQLVITPNVAESSVHVTSTTDSDDIIMSGQRKSMNPQVMTERQQHFNKLLLDIVKVEHNKFLQSLNPPMHISPERVTRWHPEFDLQNCPDIGRKELPQPPNIEKFSSARDILSTARNLFDCATPKERMMQRYEAKQKLDKQPDVVEPKAYDPVASILKGVPKSLIERIRARQAAKALDSMTRRPSQDKESNNYARLPDLARHIRNIFVTESKGVLDLDFVLAKLENSYREQIPRNDMKELLQLLAKETPLNWLTFPHIRDRDFLKINKSADLTEIIKQLQTKAEEKR